MKKSYLFALAGLAFTACTSEDVSAPAGSGAQATSGEVPITFSVDKANMGRAEGDPIGLETVNYDFGVWAYKTGENWTHTAADDAAAGGENVVMRNYLVGYWSGTYGYQPTASQADGTHSDWCYEKFGSGDSGFTFTAGDVQAAPKTSANATQYLKYWDLGKAFVNFYACSPCRAADSFVAASRTMTFNAVQDDASTDVLYGSASVATSGITATNNPTVAISFKRLNAKIRLAFYSELQGYDVEIINFSGVSETDGVICVPAKKDGETYKGYADDTSVEYVISGKPVVTFKTDGTSSVSWTEPTKGHANIVCPLWWNTSSTYSASWEQSLKLGNSYTNRIYGGWRRVLPVGEEENCGFTVNVSFKLTAQDTKEVIYVYGAKVYVDSENTQWQPNTMYTYTFKVTNTLPGSTSGPTTPGVKPTDPALFPIIFDNLSVEAMTTVEKPGENGAYSF